MSLIKLAARGEQITKFLSNVGNGNYRTRFLNGPVQSFRNNTDRLNLVMRQVNPKNIVPTSREFKGLKEGIINKTMSEAKSGTKGIEAVSKLQGIHEKHQIGHTYF